MPSSHTFLRLAAIIGFTIVALLVWQALAVQPASAHGKEIDITVTPLIPNPDRPLLRLYRVQAVYLNDREPVEDATVTMTASREDGIAAFPRLELTEVDDGTGLYVGEAVFSRFGVWFGTAHTIGIVIWSTGTVGIKAHIPVPLVIVHRTCLGCIHR